MGEIINIHVGGAGCKIGQKIWSQLQPNEKYFQENNNSHKPRALFINSSDDQDFGKKINLQSNQKYLIKEDSSNINYYGYYVNGKTEMELIKNEIQKQVENCENFQGFLYTHSIQGGLGSGYTGLLSEQLHHNYPKKESISFCLTPSPNYSNIIVEPYNAVMGFNQIAKNCDGVVMLQNESIYQFLEVKSGIEYPSYNEINEAIAFPILSILGFLEKHSISQINLSLQDTKYSKLWSCSYGPISTIDQRHRFTKMSDLNTYNCSTSNTQYREGFMNFSEEFDIMQFIKSFGIGANFNKISIHSKQHPKQIQFNNLTDGRKKVLFLNQNSDLIEQLRKISLKANSLLKKRAFCHWYVGIGIEDQSFLYDFQEFDEFIIHYQSIFENV